MSDYYTSVEPSIRDRFKCLWRGLIDALSSMPLLERVAHIFWLLGPFVLLIERSPADIWLTILALAFVVRSILKRDRAWLGVFWVKTCFVFLAVCELSAITSAIPFYSFSEATAWFRFPLFAMATVFWLATDKRLLYAMLLSTAVGMFLMTGILTLEMIIEGQKGGRLYWPYGDQVPGNYLSKVGLPAFTIMVALAIGAKPRVASIMGVLSLIGITMSVLTGERINFLIRACGGMLAALVWKPKLRRYIILIVVEIFAVFLVFLFSPSSQDRYVDNFIKSMPTGSHSSYYQDIGAGVVVFKTAPVLGIGPATHRELCPSIIGENTEFRCNNHAHNFYVQIMSETGVIGLIAACLMFASITLAAYAGFRKNRANVVAATAFVVPFGLFFPFQTTGDFFGQWFNVFTWSAIALALAAGRTLTREIEQ